MDHFMFEEDGGKGWGGGRGGSMNGKVRILGSRRSIEILIRGSCCF